MTTDAPDLTTDIPPDQAPPPPEVPAMVLPRRSPIDWDRTHFTPAFVRALAKAQAEAKTVGKDSTIEGREGVKPRKYAGADAMVEEATRALASNGIAWICASTARQPTEQRHADENGEKQWCCSIVETTSVLLHAPDVDAEGHTDDEVGMLVTYGETASIGRVGTPIDKADKAAETYLRLYLARDLCGLDRGDADDDPIKRDDAESGAGRRGSARSGESGKVDPRRQAARDLVVSRWKVLAELLRQRDGITPDSKAWAAKALGGESPTTLDDYTTLARLIGEEIAMINDDARAP